MASEVYMRFLLNINASIVYCVLVEKFLKKHEMKKKNVCLCDKGGKECLRSTALFNK